MAKKPTRTVGVLDDLLGIEPEGERSIDGLIKLIDPSRITIRPQIREIFDEDEMADLRDSIAQTRKSALGIEGTGILQPLSVNRMPGGALRLVAGERRLRAALTLQLPEVPVTIFDNLEENEVQILQFIENVQRSDLWPLEQARGLSQLQRAQGLSVRDLAVTVGKGKGWVEHRLALLKAPEDVQAMASNRPDTIGVAREIARVKDDAERAKLINSVLKGASKREIESRVTTVLALGKLDKASSTSGTVSPVRQPEGTSLPTEETHEIERSDHQNIKVTASLPDPVEEELRPLVEGLVKFANAVSVQAPFPKETRERATRLIERIHQLTEQLGITFNDSSELPQQEPKVLKPKPRGKSNG